MRHSLLVRIKAFFARDKYSFWWNELTDRDKKLAALSTRGLAGKLQDASTLRDAEEVIVIEHMLSQRLAEIQTKAAWGASILGFVGAILGASLSVALTEMLNLKYLCDKLKFSGSRGSKNLFVLLCPRQHIRTYILPLKFIPDFTG